MKAKIVQYPFNHKRFRWDYQSESKEFEYTWEQSQPRNFDTITPYIKTAPFNSNTLYEEDCALLGADYPMPSVQLNGTPLYVEQPWTNPGHEQYQTTQEMVMVYGNYGCDLETHLYGQGTPVDFEIALITESNYYSSFNWTTADFNWIWDNLDVPAEEVINLIYLKKPNYSKKISIGDIYNGNLYFLDVLDDTFNYYISRNTVNGQKQIRLYANKDSALFHTSSTNIITNIPPQRYFSYAGGAGGVAYVPSVNYNIKANSLNGFSAKYKPNCHRYEMGVVCYFKYNNIYRAYYVNGNTWDENKLDGNPITGETFFDYNTSLTYAYLGNLSTQPTNNVSRTCPSVEYPNDFSWANASVQAEYENAYYGVRQDGTISDCLYFTELYQQFTDSGGSVHFHYHHIPISMVQSSDNRYSMVPKVLIPSNAIRVIHNICYCRAIIETTNDLTAADFRKMIKVSDWPSGLHNTTMLPPFFITNAATTVLLPNLTLIGDQTNNTITVPADNTTISSYTIGEPVDRTHLNPKSVQVDAPCEYDSEGNVISRTWLTFNSYTAEQWANEYHFLGNQWNNFGSPWAYANNMSTNGDHTMTLVHCDLCEPGTYINALTLMDQTDTEVKDTLNNTYSTSAQTYYDNIGTMYAWWDEYVKSTNRNAYPDDGYQGIFYYELQPQLTKFITYHINQETDPLTNVELFEDRYTYSHELVDFADHSYDGTICGSSSSTGENTIPDATYRTYKGIYYGQSIPLLNIAETLIDSGMILGVPIYNKQVNTSDTLKYGTVASASLTFRLDIPVDNAMVYNNKLLVAFYDFEHNGVWEPWGFFRIDTIEAQDENCTSIVAHDEVYKLNKYVDDFLKNYTGATTLDRFFKDLLDYCDCEYDPQMATINNGNLNLNNVYNATKTTGLEVAHYIANISPGFVHANMDNDIVLAQYKPTDKVKTVSDYSNLVYNAYNTDMLNKVIITMNNAVIAEDQGSGTKTYYIADNPLLSKHISEAALVLLAEKVLQKYQQIPVYRPAQIKFLTSPGLDIGDVFTVVTKNSQQYNVAVMEININEGGLEIKSMGTATYPVDPSSNSQFVNLVDSIDTVQVDVDDLNDAVAGLDGRVGDIETDITGLDGRIDATEADISGLKGRMTTAEGNITSINGDISSLDSRVDDVEDGLVTVANSLATKILADSISSANDLVTVKINGDTVSNIATKAYVDNSGGLGFTPAAFIAANISISGYSTTTAWYIGRYNANVNMWNGLLVPLEKYAGYSLFQATTNGVLWGLSTSDGDWHIITNGSYSVRT